MSILICGMEMPKNCTGCPICCGLPYQYRDEKGRRPDCPLIELPPHGRLIDADNIYVDGEGYFWFSENEAPTIVEAEDGT